MGRVIKIIKFVWLTILTIISLAALCRTFYHDVGVTIDYAGILVGILAALCTVLIGWQIYSVIDFSQREKNNAAKIVEITDFLASSKREEQYRNYLSHYAIADIYAHICNGIVVNKADYECTRHRLEALFYASVLEDWEICKLIATAANRFIEQRKSKFNRMEIEEFKQILLSMEGQNFSEEFCKLLSTLQGILDM